MPLFLQGRLFFVRMALLLAVLLLIVVGMAAIYAVGHPAETTSQTNKWANLWQKQAFFAVLGGIAFWLINLVNYRRFGQISGWLYAFILLLLALLLAGHVMNIPFIPLIKGSIRWIDIPGLPDMQPSEFCKVVYVLALAWYLRYRSNYRSFTALIGPFALTLLPMAMILLEPDLGTALLMMPIFFVMLFMAGAKGKHLIFIILLAILVSPFLWHRINPYQRARISSVLLQSQWIRQKAVEHPKFAEILIGKGKKFSPSQWEREEGYHLIRSKYAIASGGLTGYGFRKGPFIKYNSFLPERYNDFVFAVIAHQWGFIGCEGCCLSM